MLQVEIVVGWSSDDLHLVVAAGWVVAIQHLLQLSVFFASWTSGGEQSVPPLVLVIRFRPSSERSDPFDQLGSLDFVGRDLAFFARSELFDLLLVRFWTRVVDEDFHQIAVVFQPSMEKVTTHNISVGVVVGAKLSLLLL